MLDPRRIASRLINLPTGAAERHRPLWLADAVGRLRGTTLKDAVSGRAVLVTGASSGIGEASAVRLGTAGAHVLLVARSADRLGDVAARILEHGGQATVHPCDLSDADAIDELTRTVTARHGGVDVLVNNAGLSIRRSLSRSGSRIRDFERTMALNYLAPVRLVLALLPGMRERRRGQIVNVSSAAVQIRTPRFAAYTASKAALDAFSECAAAEVAHEGINFSTISMPLVRTPMIAPTEMYRSFPSISPEQAADRVAQAIMHRPRRIGTVYGDLVAAGTALDPELLESIRNRAYRALPESGRAGRGEERPVTPSESREGA